MIRMRNGGSALHQLRTSANIVLGGVCTYLVRLVDPSIDYGSVAVGGTRSIAG